MKTTGNLTPSIHSFAAIPTMPVSFEMSRGQGSNAVKIEFAATDNIDIKLSAGNVEIEIKSHSIDSGAEAEASQVPPSAPVYSAEVGTQTVLPTLVDPLVNFIAPVAPFSVSATNVFAPSTRFPATNSNFCQGINWNASTVCERYNVGASRVPTLRNDNLNVEDILFESRESFGCSSYPVSPSVPLVSDSLDDAMYTYMQCLEYLEEEVQDDFARFACPPVPVGTVESAAQAMEETLHVSDSHTASNTISEAARKVAMTLTELLCICENALAQADAVDYDADIDDMDLATSTASNSQTGFSNNGR